MALAATSAHTGLESVAFAMIESSARLKTVALKSAHAMPEMPTESAVTGVRVGAGVGAGVGLGQSDRTEPLQPSQVQQR